MAASKRVVLAVLVVMIASLAAVTFYYWYNNSRYIKTEDAYIDGIIYKAGPQLGGRLLEVRTSEGCTVEAGEVLARVDDASLPPGGNVDLTLVKAPVTGVVLKVLNRPGEVIAPSQPVIMLADMRNVFLTVNVEEGKINRVRLGEKVTFTVDGIPSRVFNGRVSEIQEAMASTYSLLPTRSTSGSFVKVIQRVPVKVLIEDPGDVPLRLNQSAAVRIHLRG
ncbi:MAG: efflux RND transporter periplasmic adaptor subunit [Bacillota bacterium]